MNWTDQHCSKRKQHYCEIEEYFDNLPPELYRQGRLLRNNLAVHFSNTGRLGDILSSLGDYPHADMPFCFLDDFGFQEGQTRNRIEKHLFFANLFSFATIYTQDSILNERTFCDHDYIFLTNALSQQMDHHFYSCLPAGSIFWEYHRKFWGAYAQATLFNWGMHHERSRLVLPEDVLQSIDLLAPYKLIPIVVALLAGREDDIPKLLTIMDHLHTIQMILHDLSTLEEDLQQGKYSYPIVRMMAEMRAPLDTQYNPEGVLMAMAIIKFFSRILEECQDHLKSCRRGASELNLIAFMAYLDEVEARIHEVKDIYVHREISGTEMGGSQQRMKSHKPLDLPISDTLAKAIKMAEGYLLSDLTFKESWEVYRRGLAGAAVVTARFPAGLIIEILCSHGHDLSVQVDSFFQHCQDTNFSYYDHPTLAFADTDTLGVLLRLYRYTDNHDAYQKVLEILLGWMRASVQDSGRIPVWINTSRRPEQEENQSVRLIGEGCGAIEAKLLCGLIQYDWGSYKVLIQDSAAQILERFIQHGAGITVNYPRQYCLWRINQLLVELHRHSLRAEIQILVQAASETYPEYVAVATRLYRITPQESALLTLASLGSPAEHLFDRRWVTILLKNQRSNGSWYGEPLFFVPNRGELTTWHSSHQLTTAFCYAALKTYGGSFG
jgi:hypothetical protein